MEKKIAILMADLSGFTAMTEVHGAEAAAQMIKKYVTLVKSALKGASFMLERVGDQVVVISENANDLAYTALELLKKTGNEKNFLSIHAGLHYGDILEIDGHYYGSAINLAARIAAKAKNGRILCSEDFINALSEPASFQYVFHGKFQFKNVLESKSIVELLPQGPENTDKNMCPVCHMQIEKKDISFIHEGYTYYFCSSECKFLFEKYELHDVTIAI